MRLMKGDSGVIGFDIRIDAHKSMFFDRDAVMKRHDARTHKLLRWVGGYTRNVARNSIRNKPYGEISSPGKPPYDHYGHADRQAHSQARKEAKKRGEKPPVFKQAGGPAQGLRNILFSYDSTEKSVIVGPAGWNGGSGWVGRTIPELLENGGTVTATYPRYIGGYTRNGVAVPRTKITQATYKPRPYMGPAQAAGLQHWNWLLKEGKI